MDRLVTSIPCRIFSARASEADESQRRIFGGSAIGRQFGRHLFSNRQGPVSLSIAIVHIVRGGRTANQLFVLAKQLCACRSIPIVDSPCVRVKQDATAQPTVFKTE
jgi:hypothetical protein